MNTVALNQVHKKQMNTQSIKTMFHTCQGTYVEMFAATASQTESDDMYKTIVFLMWEVVKQLKLRVR